MVINWCFKLVDHNYGDETNVESRIIDEDT